MKLQGWWHTFPRHGLTLRLTHYLSKSWSHVPPHIFNVIQYCTTVTPSQVLPLPLLQTCRCTTLHRSHPLTSDATALITTSCVLFYFISSFLLLKSSSRSRYHHPPFPLTTTISKEWTCLLALTPSSPTSTALPTSFKSGWTMAWILSRSALCLLPISLVQSPPGATCHSSTPLVSSPPLLPPPLPLPSPRRSFSSSTPPLTWPLPCWLAKSGSLLLKSTALGLPPRQPLLRTPLPDPPLNPVPSLPLPLLPLLPLTLHPPPLPQWRRLLCSPRWLWLSAPPPLVAMFPWQSIDLPRRSLSTSILSSLMLPTQLPCLPLGG